MLMKLETFKYSSESGWSVKELPQLDSKNTLVLVFAAPEYRDFLEPLNDLRENFPKALILGCSSSGEIFNQNILDNSFIVSVIHFEKSTIAYASAQVNDAEESLSAGKEIAEKLSNDKLKSVLVLSDGLNVNGSALVEGMTANLPSDVIITGGLAGDGDRFEATWVIGDGTLESGVVVAVGMYGDDLQINYGSKGGWDMFGTERKITSSEGNVVYEIDGMPALELYKKFLGERADELPSAALLFPLSIRENHKSENQVVRTILSIDEDAQSMTFAGDVPEGWSAQLMKANFDRLIDGAYGAGVMAKIAGQNSDTLAIAISCVGRRLVLGERTEEEIEATMEGVTDKVKQVGFYSYGEISPDHFGKCELHNQTMTITTISEG